MQIRINQYNAQSYYAIICTKDCAVTDLIITSKYVSEIIFPHADFEKCRIIYDTLSGIKVVKTRRIIPDRG